MLGFNTVAGSSHSCKVTGQKSAGELDFDKTFWPSAADMDALRQEDDWWRVAEEHFSVDREIEKFNIRQPPIGGKDNYDSKNSWISDGPPSSSKRRRKGDGRWEVGEWREK